MLKIRLDKANSPLNSANGYVKLKPRTKHPASIALAHFGNLLQSLHFPFSHGDRRRYFEACHAIEGKRALICPTCCQPAKFLPVNEGSKVKAWFCACSNAESVADSPNQSDD